MVWADAHIPAPDSYSQPQTRVAVPRDLVSKGKTLLPKVSLPAWRLIIDRFGERTRLFLKIGPVSLLLIG